MTAGTIVLPKLIVPRAGVWTPAAEELLPFLRAPFRKGLEDLLRRAGSKGNDLSKLVADAVLGGTAFTAASPLYFGLWTAALTDTFNGATASEANYTSYARLSLTNNTTIFAAGSGTTTYTKTFPSDATKSWPALTGGSSTCTYMGILSGNAGTSADKGYYWCSIASVVLANVGDTPQLAANAASVVED